MGTRYRYPRTPADLRALTLEDLEDRYGGLLNRYAGYQISGLGRDDVMQELRVVLLKCQRGFQFKHRSGAAFTSYLTNALKHKVWNLSIRASRSSHLWATFPEDDTPDGQSSDRIIGLEDNSAALDMAAVDDRLAFRGLSPKAGELVRRVVVEGNRRIPVRLQGAASEVLHALGRDGGIQS